MTPLISVIMPAYNAEKYINESIKSVINQTYDNWELIIVDDGSTDNTSKIVRRKQATENRIKYIYQDNGKQGKARNTGIKHSAGEIIAFLDADDLWETEKLAVQCKELFCDQTIDLVFTQGYQIRNYDVHDYNICVKDFWNSNDIPEFVECNQIPILSVLVKKDALRAVDFFSEDIEIQNAEDYHLWLKLLVNNSIFRSLPNRLFYYRKHQQQNTYQANATNLPTLNMLKLLYNANKRQNNHLGISIIKRIKNLLSDNSLNEEVYSFIKIISKDESRFLYIIMCNFPSFLDKFKFNIAIKLISMI